MSVKQLRFDQATIRNSIEDLVGQKCSVVFSDKSSLFLQLIKFEQETLLFRDMFNRKRKFRLKDIQEIIKEIRD